MKKQKTFNFNFIYKDSDINFYINKTNESAFRGIHNSNNSIFLNGPSKSGKSYLANIWLKKNNAIMFKNNFKDIINLKQDVYIDNINSNYDQEKLFHILNHCKLYKLNILITSRLEINQINFDLKDLVSRLKTFFYLKINRPDDDMLINILTKLFVEKQFIINSQEIFQFILKNANRSYEEMFNIVNKLDTLSLEKKRQLTIPLIKEIL